MNKISIVILDSIFSSYEEEKNVLRQLDCTLRILNPPNENGIIQATKTADAVMVNQHKISDVIIRNMQKCSIISRYGIGYDNVDIDAATASGIWVANVPDYCVAEASEHALALLMVCIRKIFNSDNIVRKHKWDIQLIRPIYNTKSKTLGIIGYGRIGQAFHRLIKGFDFKKILICDPYQDQQKIKANGAYPVELYHLLEESDYISLHIPLNKETRHLISYKQITIMKKGVILINTSRGAVVDEEAILTGLKQGKIAGIGMDVFETEPLPADSELKKMENVVLTGHIAYYSEESLQELKTKTAINIVEFFKFSQPRYPINKPIIKEK